MDFLDTAAPAEIIPVDFAIPVALGAFRHNPPAVKVGLLWDWLIEDFMIILLPLPWSVWDILLAPLLANIAASITGTFDKDGNNYTNFSFLWHEKYGTWGLMQFYNLYNWTGYGLMIANVLRIYPFWFLEPLVIFIMLLTGDLAFDAVPGLDE